MVLRYRKYLPHLESPGSTYFVTFRLEGALPRTVLDGFRFERQDIQREAERQNRQLSKFEVQRLNDLYSEKIEKYLDQHHGDCWLRNPKIAQLVVNALKHFDGSRYNHMHGV